MLGLIYKDLIVLKKQLFILVVLLIFYGVLSFMQDNFTMFLYMAVLFGIFLPITTISYDERCEWNKYALCTPIKPSYLVYTKYVAAVLGLFIGFIGYLILIFIKRNTIVWDDIQLALGVISIGIVLISLYLPCTFKFGVEKSRYILIGICMIPTIIIYILGTKKIIPELDENAIKILLQIAPLIALGLFILSVCTSVYLFSKKEC